VTLYPFRVNMYEICFIRTKCVVVKHLQCVLQSTKHYYMSKRRIFVSVSLGNSVRELSGYYR